MTNPFDVYVYNVYNEDCMFMLIGMQFITIIPCPLPLTLLSLLFLLYILYLLYVVNNDCMTIFISLYISSLSHPNMC